MTHSATMRVIEGPSRKLLAGHVCAKIEPGTVLVLTRTNDTEYELHAVIVDDGNPLGPSTLASFLPPEEVDDAELLEAVCRVAQPAKKRRRKAKAKA